MFRRGNGTLVFKADVCIEIEMIIQNTWDVKDSLAADILVM
ncbi:MAG: hypothetical protein ACLQBD_24915 [Syntrophobacteraceae bacterium]